VCLRWYRGRPACRWGRRLWVYFARGIYWVGWPVAVVV
jgi:hypothetical protein